MLILVACVAHHRGDSGTGPDTGTAGAPATLANCRATQDIDVGNDGQVEYRWFHTFDENGRPTIADGVSKDKKEGVTDSRLAYLYNDDGLLSSKQFDAFADGTVDTITNYTYVGGRLSTTDQDNGADGQVDARTTSTWTDGRMVREELDRGLDGALDVIITYDWPDATHRTGEYDTDADGTLDAHAVWTYDVDANELVEDLDRDRDGMTDSYETTTWGGRHDMRLQAWDDPYDGVADNIATWEWDCP